MTLKYLNTLVPSLLILCYLLISTCSCGQAETRDSFLVGFYNVENLFDTIDEPFKEDDEFTPQGRQKWTEERLLVKCQRIARVMKSMNMPDLMGFAEVENRRVLNELLNLPEFSDHDFGIVHEESPDNRGIDVALLYNKELFEVVNSDTIRLAFPYEIEPFYTSRDILYTKLKLKEDDEPYLHVFVNHWPSRRGGVEASEPKRLFVAGELRNYLQEAGIISTDKYVLIMGDLNDEPVNKSIREVLGASPELEPCQTDKLYNLFGPADARGKGSYNYRGSWDMMDQMIVSGAFLCGNNGIRYRSSEVFYRDWLMYDDPKYGKRPNRTYGGPNYYGGFSDHLPIKSTFILDQRGAED